MVSGMNAVIRRAVAGDAPAMAEMDDLCFSLPWSEQAFSDELIKNDKAFYLVAVASEIVVGYIGQWIILDEGHITNLAVHPDYRRRGLARDMLAEMIRLSGDAGVFAHTLEVRASNEAAISLYKKYNFRISGIRKEYYSDNLEDALILWRVGSRI